MNDWESACDPVQRHELTDAQKRRLQARADRRRRSDVKEITEEGMWSCRVLPDFEEMGA